MGFDVVDGVTLNVSISLARDTVALNVSLARDVPALGVSIAREKIALRLHSTTLPHPIFGPPWTLDFSNPDFSGLTTLIFEDF